MTWMIQRTDKNGNKTLTKLIDMCKDCEDKLFNGIECRGCRCSCHPRNTRTQNGSTKE